MPVCAPQVLPDGRVGFIDFGIVGRISPITFQSVEKFLLSLSKRVSLLEPQRQPIGRWALRMCHSYQSQCVFFQFLMNLTMIDTPINEHNQNKQEITPPHLIVMVAKTRRKTKSFHTATAAEVGKRSMCPPIASSHTRAGGSSFGHIVSRG